MLIADGRVLAPLASVIGGGRCTWFLSQSNPVTARKKWIGGSLEQRGTLVVDAGAVRAILSGKSLLPAGVVRVEGQFARGDCVAIRNPEGAEIGRGLVAYDTEHATQIIGRKSSEIEAEGAKWRSATQSWPA